MPDARIRRWLTIAAAFAAAMVAYATFIPLRYTPLAWDETWRRFGEIPWLQLGLEKRADWVANGLILVPFGFFTAGAMLFRRDGMRRRQLGLALFAIAHGLFVALLEFVQIWFPPRVVSLNDMLAGYVGGIFGFLLWLFVGERCVGWCRRFTQAPKGEGRLVYVAEACALALLLHGLLPLDVVLTPDEWAAKLDRSRVNLVPFADWASVRGAIKSILLRSWAFPLGVAIRMRHDANQAYVRVGVWCIAIQLVTLPIFHRHTSITDIIVSLGLGIAGVRLSTTVAYCVRSLDRPTAWFSAAAVSSLVIFIGSVSRFQRLVRDSAEWRESVASMLAVPFARAQRSTEFEAIENIGGKLVAFAILSFLIAGWRSRLGDDPGGGVWRVTLIWSLTLGLFIELSQTVLVPLVADTTDLLIYAIGVVAGLTAFHMLVAPAESSLAKRS